MENLESADLCLPLTFYNIFPFPTEKQSPEVVTEIGRSPHKPEERRRR